MSGDLKAVLSKSQTVSFSVISLGKGLREPILPCPSRQHLCFLLHSHMSLPMIVGFQMKTYDEKIFRRGARYSNPSFDISFFTR